MEKRDIRRDPLDLADYPAEHPDRKYMAGLSRAEPLYPRSFVGTLHNFARAHAEGRVKTGALIWMEDYPEGEEVPGADNRMHWNWFAKEDVGTASCLGMVRLLCRKVEDYLAGAE